MSNHPRRYYGTNDLHFMTCSCYHRQAWLASPQRRDLFLAVFEEVRQRYGFVVIGYVAMPDHIQPQRWASHLLKRRDRDQVTCQSLLQRNAVMGRDHLPFAIRFHPHIGQAIAIFIMLALRISLLVVRTSHDCCVPVHTYPEIG
jgi:hypothetical protein